MIIVDTSIGSRELMDKIRALGYPCDRQKMPFSDAYFEGYGPEGLVGIGIERKRIQDMLDCIDSGRFTGHQRVGMKQTCRFSFLILEGYWKPNPHTGMLLEGRYGKDGKFFWSEDRPNGMRPVPYAKLRRYLISLGLGGVIVSYTRDVDHTAYDICEIYQWFQKSWRKHTALLAMHLGAPWEYANEESRSLMSLPVLAGKPPLVRRWAKELSGIGVKLSEDAARVFNTPLKLATGDESQWLKVPGVGIKTATDIVQEIMGVRR